MHKKQRLTSFGVGRFFMHGGIMNTVGTPLLWGGFAVVVVIMLAIDLLLQGRRGAHTMSMKQAATWSIVWVTLSLLFNAAFWWYLTQTQGRAVADPQALAFLTGYLIEKSLAVDNVFVWLMLFSYFSVPPALQRRVLVYGVLGAIVLRTIMIFAGSWLIAQFEWLLYVFGAFLLFTGVKMALAKEDASGIGDRPLVRWLRGHLRMTDTIEDEKFFVRKNGLLFVTPLMLVLILVELSDVIFAVDSIPAIFAVTTDPFIVLTSNLFAILGLRAMYFLLAGVAERFSMLKYGLSVILVFIGIKMLIVDFYHIPIAISLGVVFGILFVTLIVNAWVNHQNDKKQQIQ
ncbi:integral membrane protein, TerC family [Citrobacter youngae ATCC 29220]|uniref:Putative membrane-bound redox modulator Alx n=2 Tax=Citrobacter youngae TaxID=133448 RepID=D4BJG5_9ENTR|nr:integral membrane protein, TerC family [Citrobacter youngae ATCC 29220]